MTVTRGQIGDLYWHVHHDVLAEVLTEPIEARVAYIIARKPIAERETRLRWMEPVLTLDDRAMADLERARADYERAWADFRRAEADYDRAWTSLEPLHAIEHPGCPWDGQTLVFPEVTP